MSIESSDVGTADWLNLSVPATVGELDLAISEMPVAPPLLQLDLSASKFLEISSLVYMVALIESRNRSGLGTQIRLPAQKSLRDLMRTWGFQDAVESVTGLRLRRFVHPSDLQFFGENFDVRNQKYAGMIHSSPTGSFERLLAKDYFPIFVIAGREKINSGIADSKTREWREQYITMVLESQVADSLARNIVYEALINAVRHPQAACMLLASFFDEKAESLTIIVWDDGISIVDTLSIALEEGGSIHFSGAPKLSVKNRLTIQNVEGKKSAPLEITSDLIPNRETERRLLLLASTFPGITRDPAGKGMDAAEVRNIVSVPGMGLYLLTNAAIDIYGGQVAIRTAEFFMNIKNLRPDVLEAGHAVKIREFRKDRKFLGNLLTVRIPVKKRT